MYIPVRSTSPVRSLPELAPWVFLFSLTASRVGNKIMAIIKKKHPKLNQQASISLKKAGIFKGVYHEQLPGHRALSSAWPRRWSWARLAAAAAASAGNGGKAAVARGGARRSAGGGRGRGRAEPWGRSNETGAAGPSLRDPSVNVFISRCSRGSLYRNISCWSPARGRGRGGRHLYSNRTIK